MDWSPAVQRAVSEALGAGAYRGFRAAPCMRIGQLPSPVVLTKQVQLRRCCNWCTWRGQPVVAVHSLRAARGGQCMLQSCTASWICPAADANREGTNTRDKAAVSRLAQERRTLHQSQSVLVELRVRHSEATRMIIVSVPATIPVSRPSERGASWNGGMFRNIELVWKL